MNILIIGGTSGLGLEIGRHFKRRGDDVVVTGRIAKSVPDGLTSAAFPISEDVDETVRAADSLVSELSHVDVLVYAAGFLEQGRIPELTDEHIIRTLSVGMLVPALLLKRLIKKQGSLNGFIAITSTSQWIPREMEPMYAATKSGLAMLAQSTSFDEHIGKTLVVGPSGMNTNFWDDSGRDAGEFLDPDWVAQKVGELWDAPFIYCLARILRDPTPKDERVQILEKR